MDEIEDKMISELIKTIDEFQEGSINEDGRDLIISELIQNLIYYKLNIQQ